MGWFKESELCKQGGLKNPGPVNRVVSRTRSCKPGGLKNPAPGCFKPPRRVACDKEPRGSVNHPSNLYTNRLDGLREIQVF